MEPVDKSVAYFISEKPAAPLLSAIACKILILVLLARSCVSPINENFMLLNYLCLSQ
jgi:hypothetical protein